MATGDIISCSIDADGYTASITIEGFVDGGAAAFGLGTNNDPTAAKVVFTVVSEGYDAAGSLGTISRTVYGTRIKRKAYPNHAQLDETESGGNLILKVALSDFIYNDDKNGGAGTSGTNPTVTVASGWYTNSGSGGGSQLSSAVTSLACTNNSTLDYPKVVGRWASVPYQLVASDFDVEAVCFHRFAHNGKPVACVTFDAADQSAHSSATVTVTDMTVSGWESSSNQGMTVLVYKATMDIDALDDAEVIDCQFKAFPWVGDADSVLDSRTTADGVAQPDERFGPLHLLNNKGNTYGVTYAYVSPTGNDGTGVASAAEATAAAAPYLTIHAAANGIKTYNNTNYARNTTDAGIVKCQEGSYAFNGSSFSAGGNTAAWLTITRASGAARASTIINSGNNTACNGYFKISGLKLSHASTGGFRGNTTTGLLWFHDCEINLTGSAPAYAWKYCTGTHNAITAFNGGFTAFSTTRSPWKLFRGNAHTGTSGKNVTGYAVLGCIGVTAEKAETGHVAGHQVTENAVIAFNKSMSLSSRFMLSWFSTTPMTHGIAVVQNLVEAKGIAAQPVMQIAADSSTEPSNHVILWHNTIAGERANLGYNTDGANSDNHVNWSQVGNSFREWNNKDDTFAPENGARIGAWPVGYGVGFRSNIYDTSNFPGEFDGLDSDITATPDYVNDQSDAGGGAGNGDYHLGVASDGLRLIRSGQAVLPFDIEGNARRNDGTGSAGVYEMATGSLLLRMQTEGLYAGVAA